MYMALLEEFKMDYKLFLDRTTALFGQSNTGKSTIISDILWHIRNKVGYGIVIAPNVASYVDIIPNSMIHSQVTLELLNNIWARQEAATLVYKRANKPEIIRGLYKSCGSPYDEHIAAAKKNLDMKISHLTPEQDVKVMRDAYETFCNIAYKKTILENMDTLKRKNLTEDEQYTIKYLLFEPRIVVIIDDCTEQLDKLKKNDVVQKVMYQGRHKFITCIMACHTDTALSPDAKKNIFVSYYTEKRCATTTLTRMSTGTTKEERRQIESYIDTALNSQQYKYQKLVYIREWDKFYKSTATPRSGFRVGDPLVWKYCDVVGSPEPNIGNNAFLRDFK